MCNVKIFKYVYGHKIALLLICVVLIISPDYVNGFYQVTNSELSYIYRTQPNWSPKNDYIVYRQIVTLSSGYSESSIWRISTDGSESIELTSAYEGIIGSPIFSPDGKFIAFTSDQSGNLDVWLIKSDGTNLTNLTSSNLYIDASPVWSSDATMLAFSSAISAHPKVDIRILYLNTNVVDNITQSSEYSFESPSWSPDNSSIAVVARVASFDALSAIPAGVWNIDVNSSNLTDIIPPEHKVILLSWSPKENLIAIVSQDLEIWIYNILEDNLWNMTESFDQPAGRPVWSPNGEHIAFYSRTEKNIDIWSMNVDGTNLVNLTGDNQGRDEFPTWSPDSLKIAYEASPDLISSSDIWVMNADGSNRVKLTTESSNFEQ